MSKYEATFGSPRGSVDGLLALDGSEILHKHPRFFKMIEDRYPVAGAKVTVVDDGSGWRNQLHQLSLTIVFADGQTLTTVRTLKGMVGRSEVASAHRFAAAVSNAAIKVVAATS